MSVLLLHTLRGFRLRRVVTHPLNYRPSHFLTARSRRGILQQRPGIKDYLAHSDHHPEEHQQKHRANNNGFVV